MGSARGRRLAFVRRVCPEAFDAGTVPGSLPSPGPITVANAREPAAAFVVGGVLEGPPPPPPHFATTPGASAKRTRVGMHGSCWTALASVILLGLAGSDLVGWMTALG